MSGHPARQDVGHLAVDLGAGSGRVVFGRLSGSPPELTIAEVHRFEHEPLPTAAGPVWDLTGIWREVLKGLTLGASAVREAGCRSATVGVDSWAVDGTFVGPGGELLGLPHAYRDPAHAAAADAFVARHPGERADLFRRTGLQHQPFNTIFQLEARRLRGGPARGASDFLLLPDLLHFWLTGIRTRERTNASTTGLLRAADGTWDGELLDAVGAPREAFGPIIEPGTTVGPLLPGLIASCGLPADTRVVAPATHDTASAVVGVPIRDDGTAYLSSGTWSLLGLELDGPVLTEEAMRVPFTNEAGVGGRVRFLKNIAGLWLIQELRRDLERLGERFDFASLAAAAERSEPWRTLIDPDAADLAAPGDSVAKLRAAAGRAGEPTPDTPGRLARCCLDSLALAYADTVDLLQRVSGREVGPICVVGGGANHDLLNRLTAGATGRRLFVGPTEATAIGNLLVQAWGADASGALDEIRDVIARSFPMTEVTPGGAEVPDTAVRTRWARVTDAATIE